MDPIGQCPSCGDRFRPGVQACPDCGVPLVGAGAEGAEPGSGAAGEPAGDVGAAHDGSADGGDPGAGLASPTTVDLHELADAERRMVAQLLTQRRIRHSWQGGNVVVPAALVAELDLAVQQALEAGRPVLDGDVPATVYEVGGWPPAVQARLARMLDDSGIAHEWDAGGDLVVAEVDEEAVDALFDQIDAAELDAGPDPLPVLESAHAHVGRLARDPGDDRARRGIVDDAAQLAASSPPFGFEARVWRSLVAGVDDFVTALDTVDGDEVRRQAADLRQELGRWL